MADRDLRCDLCSSASHASRTNRSSPPLRLGDSSRAPSALLLLGLLLADFGLLLGRVGAAVLVWHQRFFFPLFFVGTTGTDGCPPVAVTAIRSTSVTRVRRSAGSCA